MNEIDEQNTQQNTPDLSDATNEENRSGAENEPNTENGFNGSNDPNAENAAPAHNRRRILLVVVIVLVVIIIIVAIAVGSCTATTDNNDQQDQQQEVPADSEQNDAGSNQEETTEEDMNNSQAEELPESTEAEDSEASNTLSNEAEEGETVSATTEEAAAAAATYEDILNEYRDFADYVAQGGSPENLAINPNSNTWIDYPYVTAMESASYLLDEDPSHFEYTYTDIDHNGISELLIGRSLWIPAINSYGVALLQMFTYQDGEAVELFQSYSGNRSQHVTGVPAYFNITSNDYIRSQGGNDPNKIEYAAYELVDGRLNEIESLVVDIAANTYLLSTPNGEQEEVDSTALVDFEERYPWISADYDGIVDDSPLGDWQNL